MQKVFVSFHFSDDFDSPDRLLANRVEGLLKSHGLIVTTGGALGGGPLTDRVRELIEKSDALIALMTRREKKENGDWTTHEWVKGEFGHAKSKDIRAIAIIEKGVKREGMYENYEYISYDPENKLTAFLKLSAILGIWKEESGRLVKVWIQPDEIAIDYATNAEWRYRFNFKGEYSRWQDAKLTTEPGGCFIYLPNVSDDVSIQIQVSTRVL